MRKYLLLVVAALMLAVAIATWGSVGSVALIFGLIMMGLSLVYQHFLTNREDNDYDIDQ